MTVTLRPIRSEDEPFLLGVYASTRAEELATVGWSDAQKAAFVAQQFAARTEHYTRHYHGMSSDVIAIGGVPAGQLLVARWEREIRIVDIALLPEHRGGGAGTHLLRGLMDEAARAGKVLSIHVERMNPALRLYTRLGFRPAADEGVYVRMDWTPPGAADQVKIAS